MIKIVMHAKPLPWLRVNTALGLGGRDLGVSQNRGTPIQTQIYYTPYYGQPQKGTVPLILGHPHLGSRIGVEDQGIASRASGLGCKLDLGSLERFLFGGGRWRLSRVELNTTSPWPDLRQNPHGFAIRLQQAIQALGFRDAF